MALAAAGIGQQINADHTAIVKVQQLVGAIGSGDLVDQGATLVGIRSMFNSEKRLCLRLMLPADEGRQGFAAAVLGIQVASNAQVL